MKNDEEPPIKNTTMKTHLTFTLIAGMILSLAHCTRHPETTTLEVCVRNLETDTIVYMLSRDSSNYFIRDNHKAPLDSAGKVRIELPMTGLNMILIFPQPGRFRQQAELHLLPGENYNVCFDPQSDPRITITGTYGEAEQLLTRNYNNYYFNPDLTFRKKIYTDTLPDSLLAHFDQKLSKLLRPLDTLWQEKKIDDQRYTSTRNEIAYTSFMELLTVIQHRSRMPKPQILPYYDSILARPLDPTTRAWRNMVQKLLEEYPYDREYVHLLFNYEAILNDYLWCKIITDSLKTKNPDLRSARKYLDPHTFEFYYANSLYSYSLQEPFDSVEARVEGLL